MAGKTSAGVIAAKKQYDKAPAGSKPSVKEMARKHGVDRSSIYRARAKLAQAHIEEEAAK